jgi:hypothetical protein
MEAGKGKIKIKKLKIKLKIKIISNKQLPNNFKNKK